MSTIGSDGFIDQSAAIYPRPASANPVTQPAPSMSGQVVASTEPLPQTYAYCNRALWHVNSLRTVPGVAGSLGEGVDTEPAPSSADTIRAPFMPSLAHAAESRERSAILDHMLAGSNVVAGVDDVIVQRRRDLLLQAMDGYSLDQLRKIDANGVKFRLAELKPKNLKPHQTYDQGKYDYEVHYRDGKWSGKRQIILDKSTFTDSEHPDRAVHVASHELAHAWDDAQYADTLKVNKITCLQSDSKDAVYVDPDGKGWSIQDMYRKYANEVRPLVRAGVAAGFDGKGNPVGYSLASEKEFYAEGYAVFHGNDAEARGRLQQHASELYALLNQEAEKQGTLPPR